MRTINLTKLFITTLLLLNLSVKAQESVELAQQFISSCEPMSGIPGTVVTIYGNGFSPILSENTIEFGTYTANIISATANVIKAEIPEGPVGPVELWHWRSSMVTRWAERFIVLLPGVTHSGFGPKQTITSLVNNPQDVYASDIDADDDMDIVSASRDDGKLAYYVNNGGGNFGAQQIINTFTAAQSVFMSDINEDWLVDVISCHREDDEVIWHPNLGGTFGSEQIITSEFDGAKDVYSSDLDLDGDMDVLSISFVDVVSPALIVWFENEGSGLFGQQHIISDQIIFLLRIYVSDLDSDDNLDVITASRNPDKISWFKNLGGGIFGTEQVITTNVDFVTGIFATDLDGDGDIDVLSTSMVDDKVAWYENLGSGTFAGQHIISDTAYGARSVKGSDLDGDGDIDILSACASADKIVWYENLGGGNFSSEVIIVENVDAPREIYSSDLDEDGDMDIVASVELDDEIIWIENISSLNNPMPTTTSITPNNKTVGDPEFTMTVTGTGFVNGSAVRFDGSNKTTTFVSSTQVTAQILASDLLVAGTYEIKVFNPAPGGGLSNAQTFTVNNPLPTTTNITPTSAPVGDPGFTMTVNGTGFVNGSDVRFDGSNRTTFFVSPTQLTVQILASDLQVAGTYDITVFNGAPGGGLSNVQTFTVNNPLPTTTSIVPTSAPVGSSGFTMTVTGTGFVNGSDVKFDGSNKTTTYISPTQLTAQILASDLLVAGPYPITVLNTAPGGGLSNPQTFTVTNPIITVTQPNGGENWVVGSQEDITWTSQDVNDVKIEYSTNNGTNWIEITPSIPASNGSYSWDIPNTPSSQCLVKISDAVNPAVYDESNNVFTISPSANPLVIVSSPNGGENWVVGSQEDIIWTYQDVNNVKIEYSTNNGTNWIEITPSIPASNGSYSWDIPNTPSNQCLVKISNAANPAVYDESNNVFSILDPGITVISPNGEENWIVGSQEDITWTYQDVNNVKIEYSTNTGTDWIEITPSIPASNGSYSWDIPNTPSSQCLVKISGVANPAVYDESDAIFTISPSTIPLVIVSSPNGGENWVVGSQEYITWTSQDVNNVKIEYSTNTGSDWIQITPSAPASNGSYIWTVLPPLSDQCLVKISDAVNPAVYDESNGVFTITETGPIITVTPTTLSFGDVKVNNISQRTFTVENETSATADLNVIDIDCGNDAFTITPTNFILIPSGSQVVTVTFTPTVATTYHGTINIDCNASGSPSIIVSGIGFEFPNEINVSTSYTFGDFEQTSSYKIVGIPGDEDLPLSNYVSGTPGKEGNWRAFRDQGSGNYTEYTSGSTSFNFGEGRAFWVLSKSTININPGNVSTVPLSADNSYFITPLNNGWNLITNPFKKNIPWNDVQTLNGITQSIEDYQSGGYIEPPPSQFEYYKGYYFYNSTGLPRLEIPYVSPEGTPLLKQQIEISEELEIALAIDGERKSAITIGFTEEAKPGVDKLDIFSPPSTFCVINLALYSEELESNYKYLDKEYREQIGEGQEFEIKLKNTTGKRLELITEGIENFDQYELYLLDKRLNKLYNLKEQNKVDVKRSVKSGDYSLIVGTEEYILEKKSNLLPEDYLLYQNYPNPFNPLTTIRFAMPKGGSVRLDVYNMLGELVTKLIDNKEYEAGYHEVEFSAIGGDASNLASGVYIYRLMAGEFVNVKKMILLK